MTQQKLQCDAGCDVTFEWLLMRYSSKYTVSFAKIHCLELNCYYFQQFLMIRIISKLLRRDCNSKAGGGGRGGVLLYEYLVSGKHCSIPPCQMMMMTMIIITTFLMFWIATKIQSEYCYKRATSNAFALLWSTAAQFSSRSTKLSKRRPRKTAKTRYEDYLL